MLDGCPRVAAFLARYLSSHHVEDRLLPLNLLPLKQTVPSFDPSIWLGVYYGYGLPA